MNMDTNENETEHLFTRAGLGQAPFRFLGAENTAAGGPLRKIGTIDGFDMHTTPGGTCAYCGTGIIVLCHVRSADGKTFHVGSDCILKVGDKGLRKKVDAALRAHRKAQRHAREAAKLEELEAMREDVALLDLMEAAPHPRGWEGRTFLDHAAWTMQNAGTAGKLKLLKQIKALRG